MHMAHPLDFLLQLDGVWYKKEKAKGQTTCEALVQLTEELQVDILVVGSFGRKGERMCVTYEFPAVWLCYNKVTQFSFDILML